ncbi:MAG TPA: phospholipase D-like domain-containing protein [Steroidobacteraceae bacterium]|nr:phospholipase D-like domain-containing protein [Steroidobacteraceae bacterium]
MAWSRKRMVVAALIGAVLAFVITVVALNFVTSESEIETALEHRYGVTDPQYRRELGILLGPPIIDGNRVQNFENGVEIFPAMLEAIRSARSTITFETYIYWSGRVGRLFADALSERARAGVRVHLLVDWVGSQKMDQQMLDEMTSAGVEVHRFHPLHWYHLTRMNNRTHRKLLIVDGRVGFTGGVGISDDWDGDARDPEHWRDSHYRLDGPAVAQMQAAFMDNWIKTTGKVLQGEAYFPLLTPVGTALGQVFTSSPSGGGDSMQLMYLLSITAAERTIDLSAAYFVPDPLTRKALLAALARGVRLRIVVPGELIDSQVTRRASRADWGELLLAGAEIHEFQPAMFHCKALIVDSQLVSVGSTNFDNRSFRLNDEANLNVYDGEFAAEIERVFEQDLRRSRRVTFEAWARRPWHEKLVERFSALFASQM